MDPTAFSFEDKDSLKEGLKKLLRTVIKSFYKPKDLLIIDVLIKEGSLTEKRIEKLLKMDVKLVRVSLATLKNDRLISRVTKKEKRDDDKVYRLDYYGIKYDTLVDVIRYKLDNVLNRVETLEKQSLTKASFICNNCQTTWTDLEAGELFNKTSMRFCCTLCSMPVSGDSSKAPCDLRQLIARFNEEVSPIYDIIRECEVLASGM